MKKILSLVLILSLLAITLCGCGNRLPINNGNYGGGTGSAGASSGTSPETVSEIKADDAEDNKTEITGDFSITGDGDVTYENGVYAITSAGSYTLIGNLAEGQIVVDVPDGGEVELLLDTVSISSTVNSPIFVVEAGVVTVKSPEGAYNEINDLRPLKSTEDDTAGGGAIYAECDLNITGKGSLVVTSSYNNGIHTKDDLKIKNVTLKVTAPNNALKGNDSVTVESGNLILISTGGDGIKTENTDISSKGNQRGTVSLTGGIINIYAACDGIDASYNVETSEGVSLFIRTSTYSEYSEEVIASGSSEMYLVIPTSLYSSSYRFSAYFYNGDNDGVWADATYETMVYSGRTAYYGLILDAPSNYSNVAFYRFSADSSNSLTSYDAKTSGETVNTSMNAFLFQSISSGAVSGDWVNLIKSSGGGPGGGQGSQSDKTEYSSKGIKAGNEVIIYGGAISISAMDDGIHANYATSLENGESSLGNVTVTGGTLEIVSADDGIHADSVLSIEGGTVNIKKSHEGIEGNTVNIVGGSVFVLADDDGVNAASGTKTPSINISGGYLDVTVSAGDTDGIDSNGTYTQTGGFVIVKGGGSFSNVSGALDVDRAAIITGGTIISLGTTCSLSFGSSCLVAKIQKSGISAGDYVLQNGYGDQIAAFTLSSSYSSAWICSDALTIGSSYSIIKDGSSFVSWQQSSQTQSVS